MSEATLTINKKFNGNVMILELCNRFDFGSYKIFRAAYEDELTNNHFSKITIDLLNVNYIDSSALGMLLMLRDKSNGQNKSVSLLTQPGVVLDVLKISNFEKIFEITRK